MDEIYAIMDDITEQLAAMTREERLRFFRRTTYPVPLNFAREIDGTTYLVRTHFDSNASESLSEKAARILKSLQ